MKKLTLVLSLAFVFCVGGTAIAQNKNTSPSTTNAARLNVDAFGPAVLFAGGFGLLVAGTCIGFVVGRKSRKS
jgi:hypothetical protein